MKPRSLSLIAMVSLLLLLATSCGGDNESCASDIQSAVAGTLTAQPPLPPATCIPALTPSPTPTAPAPRPTSVVSEYYLELTCPDTSQPLALTQIGGSWRYTVAGTLFPRTVPEGLSVNVLYRRMGAQATDWTFVYGGGVKPRPDGQFLVDGWIGDWDFPPTEGERIALAVGLVEQGQAAALDNEVYPVLKDVPATALSPERVYTLSFEPQVARCRDAGTNGIWPAPENGYAVEITCPTDEALTMDHVGSSWRYAIGGVVRPASVPEDLTVNIIYQRTGENATNWIFVDSGGARSHPDGQFLVEGFLGTAQFPPQPGETIGVVVALVDRVRAAELDNVTQVSPYLFDAEYLSFPIYFHIRQDGEVQARCRDAARDPHQPATGTGYTLRVTCPAADGPLTVDRMGTSWQYFVGGTLEPGTLPQGAALFVAYRRLEGPTASAGGTDWILVDKPASLRPLGDPTDTTTQQFQAEGWIGDGSQPPRPGEIIEIAVVLMQESEGRRLGNQTFRTLEQIPAIDFSFPTYVHIRQTDEPEYRCEGAESATEGQAFSDEMESFNADLWHTADGWTNGDPFWTGWRADHVDFVDGALRLRLDDQPCTTDPADCSDRPYASGEYRTHAAYAYGCFEARIKAAQNDGIVTSFFTYTGPADGTPHDEIDIEILGKDTTQIQVNYFTDGKGNHEALIPLGFDAAEEFHTYTFEWTAERITWYVDGKAVHTEDGSNGPLPTTPGAIMMNLWPGTGVDAWLNAFTYPGAPLYAKYGWVSFTPGTCMY